MIRVKDIKIPYEEGTRSIKKHLVQLLKIKEEDIIRYEIKNESLDARHKPKLVYVYTVDVEVTNEKEILKRSKGASVLLAPKEEYVFSVEGKKTLTYRPVIVGMGPAGLFCAYLLSKYGYNPLVIERGKKVEERLIDVTNFWNNGTLNTESNVQFGEGGAGTFSDGKLLSRIKDSHFRRNLIFDTFIKYGADAKIAYQNKPHIGTDKLCEIVKGIREEIIKNGGEIRYNTCLTDIKVIDGKIKEIEVNHNEWIATDILVLALGHSARDTIKMLYNYLHMEAKPFAMGVRIEHPQALINKNQYGIDNPSLPPASYKLTYKASNNRGVYSFCMCPGGYVINASSEDECLAINGMSYSKRDALNANSALVVTINPEDFDNKVLGGINLQRELEHKAYLLGNGKIPVQLYEDYVKGNLSKAFGEVKPLFKGAYQFANLNELLPNYMNDALKEAIAYFDHQIKGYARSDAILAGIESRTSSPVRILRDGEGLSNIKGIYPCGEGAGYAGGITSASVDGVKVAELIAKSYAPFKKEG